MHAEEPKLRDRPISLKLPRDELFQGNRELKARMVSGEPKLTPEKVGRLAVVLREKLDDGAPELHQAYARLLGRGGCQRRGNPYQRLEGRAGSGRIGRPRSSRAAGSLFSFFAFIQEWRAQRDSNPCFCRERATS
jgi:site-specific DNA recombinase